MLVRTEAILALATFIAFAGPQPVSAQSFDALFAQLLKQPDDPALNKKFARVAEEQGDVRHAFAAMERVVLSSPGDTEAQAEFDRLRKKILPAVTNVTVQAGTS